MFITGLRKFLTIAKAMLKNFPFTINKHQIKLLVLAKKFNRVQFQKQLRINLIIYL